MLYWFFILQVEVSSGNQLSSRTKSVLTEHDLKCLSQIHEDKTHKLHLLRFKK